MSVSEEYDAEMTAALASDDENYDIQYDEDDLMVDESSEGTQANKRHKTHHKASDDQDDMVDDIDEDDDDDDEEISLENQYYQAKSEWQDSADVNEALENFQIVIDLDAESPSVWGFRALKQSLKILLKTNASATYHDDSAMDSNALGKQITQLYAQVLEYSQCNAVSKNQSEKAINAVLDRASSAQLHGSTDLPLQEHLYNMTLQSLRDTRNDRLWFSTMLKLARLYFEMRQYQRVQTLLKQLQNSCKTPIFRNKDKGHDYMQQMWQKAQDRYRSLKQEGNVKNMPPPPPINAQHMTLLDFMNYDLDTSEPNIQEWVDDRSRGTQVLETYALEIQLYTEQRNNKKLSQIYQKCMNIRSAIAHPRILGVIRECGGKMYMREKQWARSQEDFFEAFKSYDEAGEPRRIQCLKYLMLANMLSISKINPLEASECKPYRDHPEMKAMTDLLYSYQQRDIVRFERVLRENRSTVTENDTFIDDYIRELLVTIRRQVLLKLIAPYSRIRIPYLAQQLNIGKSEQAVLDVEQLLVSLILDKRIDAHIDQMRSILIIHNQRIPGDKKTSASAQAEQKPSPTTQYEEEEEYQTTQSYTSSTRYEQCERWVHQLQMLMRKIKI